MPGYPSMVDLGPVKNIPDEQKTIGALTDELIDCKIEIYDLNNYIKAIDKGLLSPGNENIYNARVGKLRALFTRRIQLIRLIEAKEKPALTLLTENGTQTEYKCHKCRKANFVFIEHSRKPNPEDTRENARTTADFLATGMHQCPNCGFIEPENKEIWL